MQRCPSIDAGMGGWLAPASTTCSTKVPRGITHHSTPPKFLVRSSRRSSQLVPTTPQRESKKALSRLLRKEAAIDGIPRKAKSKKQRTQLWPKAVLEALDTAIRENSWESALEIFGLIRKQRWYEPRCQSYTKLLIMLGKCKQPEKASLLFELLLSEGLQPSVDVYTALISAYSNSNLIDKAFSVLHEMKSVSDCKPDAYTYSALISCCMKLHKFDLVRGILSDMSYLGIECSTVTYNIIINGYGKARMFEEMENLLNDMVENDNSVPDIFTFNSIIGAYGNAGCIEKMEQWYDEFKIMGMQPDIKTLNILIKSFGRAGMYEKMASVMKYMDKRYLSPSVVTYNIVIEIYGKAGNIEKMEEYFKKMKHKGTKPNCITYCSLVSAYSKAGFLDKVDSVLRQIENSDVILDTPFFNCMISAYGQAGKLRKMDDLYIAMEDKRCTPDEITFATMIQAYKAQGMIEAAQDLEHKIINKNETAGCSPVI